MSEPIKNSREPIKVQYQRLEEGAFEYGMIPPGAIRGYQEIVSKEEAQAYIDAAWTDYWFTPLDIARTVVVQAEEIERLKRVPPATL